MPKKQKELQKELTVKKPNQTITISNNKITLTQRKAYNALLLNAQRGLRVNPDRPNWFMMPLQEIKELAGIANKNALYLKDELEAMMKIIVSCVEDSGEQWRSFVLISDAGVKDGMLYYDLPYPIQQSLIKNDFYTTLDLMIIKTFRSKYAVILYELAMRYNKVEIPEYSLDQFKKIMGTEKYGSFGLLRLYVIEPAISEIGKKSEIELTYNTRTGGRGGKVVAIKFHIHRKETFALPEPQIQEKKSQLISPLTELLSLNLASKQARELIEKYPAEQIKRNIEFTKSKTDVKNPAAFLVEAIRGDYAKNHKPIDPKATEHIAKAKKCWTQSQGNCGATWSIYKNNQAHDCHYCKKFEEKRICKQP